MEEYIFMEKLDIRKLCYKLYKNHWANEYCYSNYSTLLVQYYLENKGNEPKESFSAYLKRNIRFDESEPYVSSYEEFLKSVYQDMEEIEFILICWPELFEEYLQDMEILNPKHPQLERFKERLFIRTYGMSFDVTTKDGTTTTYEADLV